MGVVMNRKRWIRRGATVGPGCWEWKRGVTKFGYANSGGQLVHRSSFRRFVGEIPAGQVVMHKCDNRACVRPSHLALGTQRENIADMDAKGRRRPARGSRNPWARFTESDVLDIRSLKAFGATNRTLADSYGVGICAIQQIIRRVRWNHIP